MYKFNTNMYFYNKVLNFINRSSNYKDIELKDYVKSSKIYNAITRISVPCVEYGAIDLMKRLFPQFKDSNFSLKTVTHTKVVEADLEELEVYTRKKPFKVTDVDILRLSYNHIRSKIFNLDKKITLIEAMDTLPKNSSSGFPDYTKKGDIKTVNNTYKRMVTCILKGNFLEMYSYMRRFPCTIFHRFSPKLNKLQNTYHPNFKIRQIFGAPFFIVALEKFIFYNFVESYKQAFSKMFMVGKTKPQISDCIMKLRERAKLTNKLILCGDISGCDKSISAALSTIFFQISHDFIDNKYVNLFYSLMIYYIRTPIIYSKGVTHSHGSTVSGSWITTSFNSLLVQIALNYSYYKLYKRFPIESEILFQGDDFVILLDSEEDKVRFKEFMFEFNLRIRLDRSQLVNFTQDIEFLGYFWNYYNEPSQTNEWIVSRIIYPEKFSRFKGKFRLLYRILSIIINLTNYRYLYQRLYEVDEYMRDFITIGSESFTLFDSNNNPQNIKIPLKSFWDKGWRLL